MADMTLGSLTFNTYRPDDFTIPTARRATAVLETYGGLAFFSWGIFTVGQKINITWDIMDATLFGQLDTLLQADSSVLWKPQINAAKGYTVEITNLSGKLVAGAESPYRRDVVLELLIIAEVTIP